MSGGNDKPVIAWMTAPGRSVGRAPDKRPLLRFASDGWKEIRTGETAIRLSRNASNDGKEACCSSRHCSRVAILPVGHFTRIYETAMLPKDFRSVK